MIVRLLAYILGDNPLFTTNNAHLPDKKKSPVRQKTIPVQRQFADKPDPGPGTGQKTGGPDVQNGKVP